MSDPTTPAARPLPADVAGLMERLSKYANSLDKHVRKLTGWDDAKSEEAAAMREAADALEAQARQIADLTAPAARPLPADVAGLVERILSMPHRMDCGLLGGYDGGCTCGHDQAVADAEAQARQIADLTARAEKAEAENARLREALINAAANLATVARSDQLGSPQKWQCQAWSDDALAALKGGDNG